MNNRSLDQRMSTGVVSETISYDSSFSAAQENRSLSSSSNVSMVVSNETLDLLSSSNQVNEGDVFITRNTRDSHNQEIPLSVRGHRLARHFVSGSVSFFGQHMQSDGYNRPEIVEENLRIVNTGEILDQRMSTGVVSETISYDSSFSAAQENRSLSSSNVSMVVSNETLDLLSSSNQVNEGNVFITRNTRDSHNQEIPLSVRGHRLARHFVSGSVSFFGQHMQSDGYNRPEIVEGNLTIGHNSVILETTGVVSGTVNHGSFFSIAQENRSSSFSSGMIYAHNALPSGNVDDTLEGEVTINYGP